MADEFVSDAFRLIECTAVRAAVEEILQAFRLILLRIQGLHMVRGVAEKFGLNDPLEFCVAHGLKLGRRQHAAYRQMYVGREPSFPPLRMRIIGAFDPHEDERGL